MNKTYFHSVSFNGFANKLRKKTNATENYCFV